MDDPASVTSTKPCPRCGWTDMRPALRSGVLDGVMRCLLMKPYRCRKCRLRFYRSVFRSKPTPPAVNARSMPSSAPHQDAPTCIMILDHDAAVRKFVHRILDREGYDVREAADGSIALAELHVRSIPLVIASVGMHDDALTEIRALRRAFPD